MMVTQLNHINPGFTDPIMTYILNPKRDWFLAYMPFILGICALTVGCALFAPAWNTLTMKVSGTLGPMAVIFLTFWRKKSLLRFNSTVTVFPEGFSHSSNGKLVNVRWDDVSEVYQDCTEHYSLSKDNPTDTTNKFKLCLTDGQRIVFDLSSTRKSYKKYLEGLGNIIHRECTNRIFSRLVKEYEAGQTVSFGDSISINKNGLITKKEILTWDKINAVQITYGFIAVQKDGKWLKREIHIPVAKLPNVFVLLMIADYALKSKASHKISS